jgi:hypothetical protein
MRARWVDWCLVFVLRTGACHILVGEALGHRQLGRLCVDEWDNIKSYEEIVGICEGACWIEQALGGSRSSTLGNKQ